MLSSSYQGNRENTSQEIEKPQIEAMHSQERTV
jgi:hypothetical protein